MLALSPASVEQGRRSAPKTGIAFWQAQMGDVGGG